MPQISALFIIVIMLGGCGDIYTKEEAAPPPPAVNSGVHLGVFVDSPVKGVSYQTYLGTTASITGTTDKQGTFYYYPGETVKFYMGNVLLGTSGISVKAQTRLTPVELTTQASLIDDTTYRETAPTNLARFLQTLDSDSDLSNGIDINSSTTTLALNLTAGQAVYFATDLTGFPLQPAVITILNGRTLKSEEATWTHIEQTLASKFTSAMIQGKTYVGVWELGTSYSTYIFDNVINGSVEIIEEKRFMEKKSNLTGSWKIEEGLLKLSNIKDKSTGLETFPDRTMTLLATTDTSTYLVKNSDVFKDLGAIREAAYTFANSEINGSTYTLLTSTGNYGIFDFNQSLVSFPEDNNGSFTWSIDGSGELVTVGHRTETIKPLVNRGEMYKVDHTLSGTTQKASFVNDGLKFFRTMIPGSYYCVTNKGLFYKLVLTSDLKGMISYFRDTNTLQTDGKSSSITWSINSDYQLDIRGVYNSLTQDVGINIVKSLEAMNSHIYFVKNVASFTTGLDEYTLMYKAAPKKTIEEVTGTYNITYESYDATTAVMSTSTSTHDSKMIFSSNGTGYIQNNTSTNEHSNFTWSIQSDGTILRRDTGGNWSAKMVFMHDFRGTIRIVEEYNNDARATLSNSVDVKFYTFIKQP